MKKVFQIKLKSIAKIFTLVVATSLVTFTGCKSYDGDITDLQGQIDKVVTDVATLKTSVAALQTSVSGMTYIKSITMGTDGKLTITPSTGAAIVYDAKTYVTYDIALSSAGVLTVNGVNKGAVTIPALSFDNGVLKSGTTTVADLTSWLKTGLTVVDGYLAVNGQKTSVAIPVAAGKTVKDVTLVGTTVTVTYTDGATSTFANAPIVTSTSADGTLVVNGVDTKVVIKNTFSVIDGELAVNGVKTGVKIPTQNTSTIIINKDTNGNIISATVSDGKDSFVVKVNPSTELLSGLLFVPDWIDGGVNAVEVGYIMDKVSAPAVSVKALFTQQNVTFRFNPTAADVSKTTWSFVNNAARLTVSGVSNAPGDATTLFQAPTYTSNNDGSGNFTLKVATWAEPAAGKTHLFALQADGKDFYSGAATHVVSDYVKVITTAYTANIRNTKAYSVAANTGVLTQLHTPKQTTSPIDDYYDAVPSVTLINDYNHAITKGTQVDLNTLVLGTAFDLVKESTLEGAKFGKLGVDYKFEYSLPLYKGTDGITDQNSKLFVELNGSVLKAVAAPAPGDRTPLVLVKLKSAAGNVLAEKYIKFKITDTVEPGGIVPMTVPAANFNYSQLFGDAVAGVSAGDYKQIAVSWDSINAKIYNPLGLTHNQFQLKYGSATVTVKATVNGVNDAAASLVKYPLNRSLLGPDVDTYAMTYNVTPLAKFGTTVLVYTFDTGVATDAKVQITISYTVNKPTLDKAIISAYQYAADPVKYPTVTTDAAHTVYTQGIRTVGPPPGYAMELNLGEGFGFGSAALQAAFGVAAGKIDPATQEFIVTDNYVKAGVPSFLFSQAAASQTSIPALLGTSNSTGVKMGMNPANPLDVDYRAYPVNFKTTYPNGEVDNFNYTVLFKNPLTIELESTADFDLLDVVTGAKDQIDLSKNYVVKMLGEVIFNKTGITAKAADYGITAPTMTYTVPNVTPAFAYAYSFASPIATWENAGTKLTKPQKISDAKFVFGTSFANISKIDAVNVNPDLSLGIKRK